MTIRKIADFMLFFWGMTTGAGVIFFLLKYQLEWDKYFPTLPSLLDLSQDLRFINDKWEVLLLCFISIVTLIAIAYDSPKWRRHGEIIFSQAAMPTNFKKVPYGRYLLAIVFINAVLFIAMAATIHILYLFTAMMSWHHINGVIWIKILRVNLNTYLNDPIYEPPSNDPHADFVRRRRKVIQWYMFDSNCLVKDVTLALLFGTTAMVSYFGYLQNQATNILTYTCLVLLKLLSEWIMHKERNVRDQQLAEIDADQTIGDIARETAN